MGPKLEAPLPPAIINRLLIVETVNFYWVLVNDGGLPVDGCDRFGGCSQMEVVYTPPPLQEAGRTQLGGANFRFTKINPAHHTVDVAEGKEELALLVVVGTDVFDRQGVEAAEGPEPRHLGGGAGTGTPPPPRVRVGGQGVGLVKAASAK